MIDIKEDKSCQKAKLKNHHPDGQLVIQDLQSLGSNLIQLANRRRTNLNSKKDGWKLLIDVISENAHSVLTQKFNESASWTIVQYGSRSGSEIGFWIFKREPGADLIRSSGGILIAGINLYHIIRSTDGLWYARAVSLYN